jgi:hypothetical protein
MLGDLMNLLDEPDALVCVWRDGELFIEPVAAPVATTAAGLTAA